MILLEDWQQSPTFFLIFVIVVAVLLIVECRIAKQHPDEPHTLGKETYTLPWCFSGSSIFQHKIGVQSLYTVPDKPHTPGKETYTLPWSFSGGVFFGVELECRVSIQLTVMVDWV